MCMDCFMGQMRAQCCSVPGPSPRNCSRQRSEPCPCHEADLDAALPLLGRAGGCPRVHGCFTRRMWACHVPGFRVQVLSRQNIHKPWPCRTSLVAADLDAALPPLGGAGGCPRVHGALHERGGKGGDHGGCPIQGRRKVYGGPMGPHSPAPLHLQQGCRAQQLLLETGLAAWTRLPGPLQDCSLSLPCACWLGQGSVSSSSCMLSWCSCGSAQPSTSTSSRTGWLSWCCSTDLMG